ncbi:hypothetical protein CYL31_01350 [Marinomonas sp. A3A]|uniref:hypothetical protein n=1 Tax=Marinomonas sp. A3A TaxID=2065312 RepID=UPI001BB34DD0|nr:hypothetical protein [Marinomonas sp. A3A]QUX90124.1 hypothetical protein CYL31_01350 [Marinomonas sp. A3A]
MADLILPSTPITKDNYRNFLQADSLDIFKKNNGILSDLIPGNNIYNSSSQCYATDPSEADLKSLNAKSNSIIKVMMDTYGEDVTMGIAEVFRNVDISPSSMIGVAGGVQGYADTKGNILIDKMNEVSKLMEQHHQMLRNNINSYSIRAREANIQNKVIELNKRFRNEIEKHVARRKQQKKSHFTNPNRAVNLARDGKNTTSFYVKDRQDFKKLVNMTRYIKVVGKGLIALDFLVRLKNVYNDYDNGKDYARTAVGQFANWSVGIGTSYAAFTALGYVAASAGVVVSGPVLVLVLAVGAVATVLTASATGNAAQSVAENIYDRIVSFFSNADEGAEIDAYTY